MAKHRAGFSLVELLIVVTLVGIVAGLAAPAMTAYVHRLRVRTTLDAFTADVYRARVVAIREADRYRVRFEPALGCAQAYLFTRAADGATLDSVAVAGGVCMSSNVPRPMVINSRGMLVGSPRMVHARAGAQEDSVSVSIAGRIYRWY